MALVDAAVEVVVMPHLSDRQVAAMFAVLAIALIAGAFVAARVITWA